MKTYFIVVLFLIVTLGANIWMKIKTEIQYMHNGKRQSLGHSGPRLLRTVKKFFKKTNKTELVLEAGKVVKSAVYSSSVRTGLTFSQSLLRPVLNEGKNCVLDVPYLVLKAL